MLFQGSKVWNNLWLPLKKLRTPLEFNSKTISIKQSELFSPCYVFKMFFPLGLFLLLGLWAALQTFLASFQWVFSDLDLLLLSFPSFKFFGHKGVELGQHAVFPGHLNFFVQVWNRDDFIKVHLHILVVVLEPNELHLVCLHLSRWYKWQEAEKGLLSWIFFSTSSISLSVPMLQKMREGKFHKNLIWAWKACLTCPSFVDFLQFGCSAGSQSVLLKGIWWGFDFRYDRLPYTSDDVNRLFSIGLNC